MTKRPYQETALKRIIAGFKEFKKLLAVLPTGSGKTIIFAWLAQAFFPAKSLILAHREELIDQAINKIHQVTGVWAEKEKAEYTASSEARIVVASVQSMIRRLDRWPADHFGLIVADEAHHAVSPSWQKVLNHFNGHVLGVTATPDRGDARSLGEYFEGIAIDVPLVKLIDERFLCPITVQSVPLEIDLTEVHLQAGDFADRELGSLLEPYLDQVAQAITEHASFRKVLAFLPLIDTSQKFVEACQKAGLRARHVDGNSKDRQEALRHFAHGAYDVLSNAMLLTEGFDEPTIDCVLILRPTKSRPLYAQMVGRGTRIHPIKENLLLLDFLWLHERHRIVHPADLVSHDAEEADIITQLSQKSGGRKSLMALAKDAIAERERILRERLAAAAERKAKYISAEEFCIQHNNVEAALYEPVMKWETKPVTDKQAKFLLEANIDPEALKGRGHASVLLDMIFKDLNLQLAPQRQRWRMAQEGHPNPWKATKQEARQFFAQLNRKK